MGRDYALAISEHCLAITGTCFWNRSAPAAGQWTGPFWHLRHDQRRITSIILRTRLIKRTTHSAGRPLQTSFCIRPGAYLLCTVRSTSVPFAFLSSYFGSTGAVCWVYSSCCFAAPAPPSKYTRPVSSPEPHLTATCAATTKRIPSRLENAWQLAHAHQLARWL